jgi:uncharacterized protein YutE (UPF0331/DUF86 family)
MADDVVLSKTSSIERCVERIREEYGDDDANLYDDITRQDSILLNLQRACQQSIDLAMHLVRTHALGAPETNRQAFEILAEAGLLESGLAERLKGMAGFRNIAIHNDTDLDLDIVRSIIRHRLSDFTDFTERVLKTDGFRSEMGAE